MQSPHSDPARKGVQLAEAGDYKGAASAFKEAAKLDPNDDNAYFNLGLMLEKSGDFRGARDAYRRASEIDNRSKYREAQIRAQGQLLAAARREDASARAPARIRDLNNPDNGDARGAIARNNPRNPGGDLNRVFPRDLKIDNDVVPPDPELALREPAKLRKPLPTDPPSGNNLTGQALPDPAAPIGPRPLPRVDEPKDPKPPAGDRPKTTDPAPMPKPARGQPRVLVVQAARTAAKPDELSTAAAQAAAEVEWQLLQLGGVLLVDRAGVAEEPAAALKTLEPSAAVAALAKAGRDAGADVLVLVDARVSPQADLPNRLDTEVRSRVIRCDEGRELTGPAAKDSAAGDNRETTARQVVGAACEQLAKKLPALVAADWKRGS